MPKNFISKCYFYINDVISDGIRHDLLQYLPECGRNEQRSILMAFGELKIMWPVAFVLEFAFVDKLAHMLAFRIVTPQDRPIFITLAISSMIVCIMCPCMSLVATILFKNAGSNVIATWCQNNIHELPSCFLLADLLPRTIHPSDLQKDVS